MNSTYNRAHSTFSASDVDEHEEYGDQQGHPPGHQVCRYQETDERCDRQHYRGEVGIHEKWFRMPRQVDLKTSQGPCIIGYQIKQLVTAQWFKKYVKLFILEPIGGCLGLAHGGDEKRL